MVNKQWGNTAVTSATVRATFPLSFSKQCYSAAGSILNRNASNNGINDAWNMREFTMYNITNTGFNLWVDNGTVTIWGWIAIGQ